MRFALGLLLLATTARATLTPPPSLSVMADTPTTLKLQWSAPTEAECAAGPVCQSEVIAWMVERCTGTCTTPASDTWTLIGVTGVGTTTFTATGLSTGVAYSFRVRASPYSSTGFGTPSTTTTTGATTSTTTTTTTTTTVSTTTVTTTTVTTTTVTTTTVATTTTTSGTGPTTTTTRPLNPTITGLIPAIGQAKDVVLNAAGTTAYVSSVQFGMSTVDVSSPGSAHATGFTIAPFSALTIALVGTTKAVSGSGSNAGTNGANFHVLDLSTSPTQAVGSLNGTFTAVASDGTRAYACEFVPGNPSINRVDVISIATPSSPAIVGTPLTVPGCTGLKVVGTTAYVASSGLRVLDVTTTSPVLLGSAPATLDGPATIGKTVAVNGAFVYVAGGSNLYVFNVATPSSPTLVLTIATPTTAVAVDGTKLYTVDATNFRVYDVSTPSTPTLLGTKGITNGDSLVGVAAKGTNVYSTGGAGLYVWNVATPSSPSLVATISGLYNNWSVAQAGNLAVTTANAASLGLRVIDTSNPSLPVVKGGIAGILRAVRMTSTTAYVCEFLPGNPGTNRLDVVSLANPASPATIATLPLPGCSGLALVGSTLYVAGGGLLKTIDVTTPSNPQGLGTVPLAGSLGGVSVASNTAYVAANTNVYVVDVTTPQAPTVTTSIPTTSAVGVSVSGTELAVIDFTNLKLYNVTTPASPTLSSTSTSYGTGGTADAVVYVAPLVYMVSAQNLWLTVVDASNVASPSLVSHVGLPGAVNSVAGDASRVYVGDPSSTLDIITLRP
jgi:hypothetical protein